MLIMTEVVNTIFVFGLFLNAVFFIPQIIALIKTKSSHNFSLLTFLGFNIIQLAFTLHGFAVKDYFLAFGYLASLITCGFVTFLIFLYKFKGAKWNTK